MSSGKITTTILVLLAIAEFATFSRVTAAKSVGEIVSSSPLTTEADKKKLLGGCDYDPYEKLKQQGVIGGGAKVVPTMAGGGLRDGIDPALACRLTKLVEFAQQRGCAPRITSAFRSIGDQQRACVGVCGNPNGCARGCARPGGSCHQYGLAVDMPSRCKGTLAVAARQFGLRGGTAGYPNPIHFQCIEHTRASCSSRTPSCNNGMSITPDLTALANIPNMGAPDSGGPPGGAAPAGAPSGAPPQALPPSQQPFQNIPQPTPISNLITATSGISIPFPDLTTSTSTKKRISAIEEINAIANPISYPAETVTTAPLVLTVSGSDVQTLTQNQLQPTTPTPDSDTYRPTPPGAQQTFVSTDLSQNPPQNIYSPQERSTLQTILATMKETLLRALEYLRPFGRPLPQDSAYDERAE